MSDYRIFKQINLGPQHVPTGKTHHYDEDQELPHPTTLKIIKFENTEGFYLLHFDTWGNEITDTFHETIDDAMAQADWEYQVKSDEWVDVESKEE